MSWPASDANNAPVLQEDDRTNYSAIWVFTPRERKLEVFKQFEVKEKLGATKGSGTAALTLVEPPGGYKELVRTVQLNPEPRHDKHGKHDRDDDDDDDVDDDDEDDDDDDDEDN